MIWLRFRAWPKVHALELHDHDLQISICVWRAANCASSQAEMYALEGLELDRSTLAGCVGGASRLLAPLADAIRGYVLSAGKPRDDNVPVPLLALGNGQTNTGRVWTDVRDDPLAGCESPPAVWFVYSPNRRGEHPGRHLKTFHSILEADAYAGFKRVVRTEPSYAHRLLGSFSVKAQ